MKRIRLSNRVKILALVATAAIFGAACSPALVAPGATSTGQAGAVEAALQAISGVVETMSADSWTVGGQEVAITAQTEIANSIQVGDSVQVQVERRRGLIATGKRGNKETDYPPSFLHVQDLHVKG